MSQPITHADLVARALDALPGDERVRVDRALESDAALRRQFDEIAAHLLRYDHLPPAPPAPAVERLNEALERSLVGEGRSGMPDLGVLQLQDRGRRSRASQPRHWAWRASALAAVVLLFVGAWVTRGDDTPPEPGATGLTMVPGPGLELWRDDRKLPAPARAARGLAVGDVLRCSRPAEAQIGKRVRLVLDAGAALAIDEFVQDRLGAGMTPDEEPRPGETTDAVRLDRGRAWFEVSQRTVGFRKVPFEVRTPFGPVRVLGTAFEVDLRNGRLEVSVAHGRVAAAGQEIAAGFQLHGTDVSAAALPAGGWFSQPRLQVETRGTDWTVSGGVLRLRLLFSNAGQVPIRLRGPGTLRTAIWISFETSEGRTLRELPVHAANVVDGQALLDPGSAVDLEPGASRALTIKIPAPSGPPGAYRCRALYRPEGLPAVLSAPLEFEVR